MSSDDLALVSGARYSLTTSPSPYTASTAVQSCYYHLSAANSDVNSHGAVYSVCAIDDTGVVALYAMSLAAPAAAAAIVGDEMCNSLCRDVDADVVYATAAEGYDVEHEWCGGAVGSTSYVSLYTLAAVS